MRLRVTAIAFSGIFFLALIVIWATAESRRTRISDVHEYPPLRNSHFDGDLGVTITGYDRTGGKADVEIELDVTGLVPGEDVQWLSFSEVQNLDGSRDWHPWIKKPEGAPPSTDCFDVDEELYDAPGARPRTHVAKTSTFLFPMTIERSDAWFPFDERSIMLQPLACTEAPDNACMNAQKVVRIRKRTIALDDSLRFEQYMVLQVTQKAAAGPAKISIRRQVFVRLLPLIFLTIACVFLYYVLRYEEPREQVKKVLGTIATLWGLRSILVPKQILIFPTFLDYALLALIAIAFVTAILKFEMIGGPNARPRDGSFHRAVSAAIRPIRRHGGQSRRRLSREPERS